MSEAEVAASLSKLLNARPEPSESAADLVLRRPDGRPIVVEVKRMRAARIDELRGRLAMSILQLRKLCGPRDVGLVVVSVPTFGERTEREAALFMREFAPEMGWLLLSDHGAAVGSVPALELEARIEATEESVLAEPPRSRQRYSDLNRWLLKVLLMADQGPGRWGGPTESIGTVSQLSSVAGVSGGKAHDFYTEFAGAGYLRRGRRLEVVRVEALLEEWLGHEDIHAPPGFPARWRWGVPDSIDDVVGRPGPDFALASWEAVRRMGWSHTTTPTQPDTGWQIHVLAGSMADALTAWDLEPVQVGNAAPIWLYRPPWPESIRRGRVRLDGLPVVDALQAALDVRPRTARGPEQAKYILERLELVDV